MTRTNRDDDHTRTPGTVNPSDPSEAHGSRSESCTPWRESWRASPRARAIADRHYNRQSIGSPQFVPPGRCVVLEADHAAWVTSWPFAEYVQHAWPGAWVNSLFRREGGEMPASEMILWAVAHTRHEWPRVPDLGMVSFIDPKHVPGTKVRGQTIYGYCYQRAGFRHVGFTKAGLWTWQLLANDMPDPAPAWGAQAELEFA